MKSILLLLIKLVSIATLLSFFSHHAYSEESKVLSPIAKEFYREISEIVDDPKLTPASKIKKLENFLSVDKKYVSADEFSILFRKAEPTLFLDAEDPIVSVWQIILLMGEFQNPEVWVFSEPREKVTSRIINLKDLALKKNANNTPEDLTVKGHLEGIVNMFLASELSSQGRYEDADKSFDELFKNIEITGSLYPQVKYACSLNKLKSLLDRGDIKSALNLSNQLDDQFDSMVDFIRLKSSSSAFEDVSILVASFKVDLFLGKYDEVIRKANWLSSFMPIEDKNLKMMKNRASLIRTLAFAYGKKGDEIKRDSLNNQAEILENKVGYVDYSILFKRFGDSMGSKNFDLAKNIVEQMRDFFSKAYPFANANEKNIFEKISTEQLAFIQSEILESKKPLEECNSEDCLRTKLTISELTSEINSSGSIVAKEFLPAYLELLQGYESLEINKNDLSRMAAFMTKLAPILEEVYFFGMEDGTLTFEDQLNQLISLHSYYAISDKQYASYFARTYINKLQKIRSNLKLINLNDLQFFTDAQAETLKDFSSTFFDIGDIDSALLCLKIIKENEFYDFVRRGSLSEGFFTSLPADKYEDDYNLKVERITNEIKSLKSSQLKKISSAESTLVSQAIIQKQNELLSIRARFKSLISTYKDKKTDVGSKLKTFKTKDDEAIIQIFITDDSVQSYLITSDGVKRFITEAKRDGIYKLILEFNLMLSKRLPISKEKIEDLSEFLVSKPLAALKNPKIKKIKILADSYLNLIPIGLLTFNEKEIGERFVIEHIGLGENTITNLLNGDSLDVFGASKGNDEFSKLPGVRVEVDELMSLPVRKEIKKRSSYLDDDFTNASLIESLRRGTSFVHIASHFQANGNIAGSSKLLLGDGTVVSLEELRAKMPQLKSELITLSACETNDLIPSSKGKAFDGLSNVFQTNGARNVISTTWAVSDDATSIFMGVFYSILLNNNLSPSVALSLTQNIFRSGSISVLPEEVVFKQSSKQNLISRLSLYSHPYYWAAFRISSLN
jgi:CHAT domain-containing protein